MLSSDGKPNLRWRYMEIYIMRYTKINHFYTAEIVAVVMCYDTVVIRL